jgi:dienelactone hydrolase
MKSKSCHSFLLLAAIAVFYWGTACGETVSFRSTEATFDTEPLMLAGELVKPEGNGPFPAVVLLYGCAGKGRVTKYWADTFASWGYAALIVDSLGPRRVKEICTDGSLQLIYYSKRAQDAYDARAYLATLPFVDPARIAVAGWSHGGRTVLEVLRGERTDRFQAAVAFYPYCDFIQNLNAPVLILIGEMDDWTPAHLCRSSVAAQRNPSEIVLKVYPGAYHVFDTPGTDRIMKGSGGVSHRLKYDREAATDARGRVKEFLEKYLK